MQQISDPWVESLLQLPKLFVYGVLFFIYYSCVALYHWIKKSAYIGSYATNKKHFSLSLKNKNDEATLCYRR